MSGRVGMSRRVGCVHRVGPQNRVITPPKLAYHEIRSASGWYASYWNAVLLFMSCSADVQHCHRQQLNMTFPFLCL